MTHSQRVEKFIKDCFDELSLNIKQYFWYHYDDVGFCECRWTDSNGDIDVGIVEYASKILGIDKEDVLSANYDVIAQIKNRYPCFDMLKEFWLSYKEAARGHGYRSLKIMEDTFEQKPNVELLQRYNFASVRRRLTSKLKELDKLQPGIYHENADMKNLSMITDNFCNYEHIEELSRHCIEMGKELIGLFIKAVTSGLSETDIKTYNLLVSFFEVRDRYYIKAFLYYDQLMNVKDVYADVNEENIFDYIKIIKPSDFQPWLCPDFLKNPKLVLEYASIFLGAKGDMRKFADNVVNFDCAFTWSDAEPEKISDETKALYSELGISEDDDDDEYIPIVYINIEKTYYEIGGNTEAVSALRTYCRPARLGGIDIKTIPLDSNGMVERFSAVIGKLKNVNYVEQCLCKDGGGII